jgi:hypothetical protein
MFHAMITYQMTIETKAQESINNFTQAALKTQGTSPNLLDLIETKPTLTMQTFRMQPKCQGITTFLR